MYICVHLLVQIKIINNKNARLVIKQNKSGNVVRARSFSVFIKRIF